MCNNYHVNSWARGPGVATVSYVHDAFELLWIVIREGKLAYMKYSNGLYLLAIYYAGTENILFQ